MFRFYRKAAGFSKRRRQRQRSAGGLRPPIFKHQTIRGPLWSIQQGLSRLRQELGGLLDLPLPRLHVYLHVHCGYPVGEHLQRESHLVILNSVSRVVVSSMSSLALSLPMLSDSPYNLTKIKYGDFQYRLKSGFFKSGIDRTPSRKTAGCHCCSPWNCAGRRWGLRTNFDSGSAGRCYSRHRSRCRDAPGR
jgi:hypothetical protein